MYVTGITTDEKDEINRIASDPPEEPDHHKEPGKRASTAGGPGEHLSFTQRILVLFNITASLKAQMSLLKRSSAKPLSHSLPKGQK